MASSKEFVQYVMDSFSLQDMRYRAMMGEYVLYYKDKVIGGMYDNRLLLKKTKSVPQLMSNAVYEIPYPGAKEMLLVEDFTKPEQLEILIKKIYEEVPLPKKKARRKS